MLIYEIRTHSPFDWHDRLYYYVWAAGLSWGHRFRFQTKAAAHAWAQAQGWEPAA